MKQQGEEPGESLALPGRVLGGVLDDSNVAVIGINSVGIMTHVSAAAARMFRYPVASLVGDNVSMLMPAHHRRHHDGYLERYLDTGVKGVIGRTRKTTGQRSDGSVFPIHLAVGEQHEDGSIRFVGIIHDISGYESSLVRATRLGRIVEESADEVYVFAERSLKFTMANRSAIDNLGYSWAELQNKSIVDIEESVSVLTFTRQLVPLLSGETDRVKQLGVFQRCDGSSYDVEMVMTLSDAVSPPEIVAIVRDISERKQLESELLQAQKMESIGQLSGGMAHDFNNLLGVISGNLELLKDDVEGSDCMEFVDDALDAVQVGVRLTQRLLAFAQRVSLAPQEIDINAVLIDLVEMLRHTLGKNVALHTILASDLWPVLVDRSQLENALLNLAINARDAMQGKPDAVLLIRTRNECVEDSDAEGHGLLPGEYVVIEVADNGPGIKLADHEKIFEPFYTTKKEIGGSGLGLSMIYGFAQQSGGHIGVASEPGGGARFSLRLSRAATSAASDSKSGVSRQTQATIPRQTSQSATSVRNMSQGSKKVLVVEDDPSLRALTTERLKRLGYNPVSASDGEAALLVLSQPDPPELVITDQVMPGSISGYDVARHALTMEYPPALIITTADVFALPTFDDREKQLIHVLSKPYDANGLLSAMASVLKPAENEWTDH